MTNVLPLEQKPRVRVRHRRGAYTVAELGRKVEAMEDDVTALKTAWDKFDRKFNLCIGLLIGAMAASGLIKDEAGHAIKAIVSAIF